MKLILQEPLFEYDIRGLLMAFYPGMKFETDPAADDPAGLTVSYADRAGDGVLCTLSFKDGAFSEEAEVLLDLRDRSTAKTALKQALYGILCRASGRTLPWGTLTGIRPTKIATAMLNAGKSGDEVLRHMEGDLLCSPGKAALSLEIARREKEILDRVGTGGWSLYVGIPFCPTTCLYCSFTSFPFAKYRGRIGEYLDALEKELDWAAETFRGQPLHTVYFGGGTPTTPEPPELMRLLRMVADKFDLSHCLEWTVEAGRPDSVTPEKLDVLRSFPVTRLSVNPQTMHQKTLDLIGRRHTVDDVRRAYQLAREKGFDDINMDLIVGLPGETDADVYETVREVSAMRPDNVTVHSLALKRAARLNLEHSLYEDLRMENSDEVMDACREMLGEIGLRPYYLYRQKNMAGNQENTGYARAGAEGLYNVLIMEEVESIVALGAGATSKRVQGSLITRAENVKNVDVYLSNVEEMIERKRRLFS